MIGKISAPPTAESIGAIPIRGTALNSAMLAGKLPETYTNFRGFAVFTLGSDTVPLTAGTDLKIPFYHRRMYSGDAPENEYNKIIAKTSGAYLIYAKYQLQSQQYRNTAVDVELQLWRGSIYKAYSAYKFLTSSECGSQMTMFNVEAGDEIRATILKSMEDLVFTAASRTELVIVALQ